MNNIYVDYINFEFEESPNYHDILKNSGSGSQTLLEQVISPSYIYVDIVNLEIPVVDLVQYEVVTCINHGTQTIDEVIEGTPVPEPEVVPIVGGAGQRIRVMGGRPWSEEDFSIISHGIHEIEEAIVVSETLEVVGNLTPLINAKIRRPVYEKQEVEILSYVLDDAKITLVEQSEQGFSRKSKKEEEELILLGLI